MKTQPHKLQIWFLTYKLKKAVTYLKRTSNLTLRWGSQALHNTIEYFSSMSAFLIQNPDFLQPPPIFFYGSHLCVNNVRHEIPIWSSRFIWSLPTGRSAKPFLAIQPLNHRTIPAGPDTLWEKTGSRWVIGRKRETHTTSKSPRSFGKAFSLSALIALTDWSYDKKHP